MKTNIADKFIINPYATVKIDDRKDNMDIKTSGNKIEIDGGKVVITKAGFDNYYIKASGFTELETSSKPLEPDVTYDPHYYYNGDNGLTVEKSVNRVINRVKDKVHLNREQTDRVAEDIRKLIVDNKGRDTAYRLTGGIKKGMEEGIYGNVPFDVLFRAFVRGYMQ